MELQPFPSSMLSYPDAPDFDYSTFLQSDMVAFHDPSPHTHPAATLSEPTGHGAPPGPDTRAALVASTETVACRQQPQKQRLERRGHTKSRRGCYNCKRRRIKCQETRPSCGHCIKTGLKCEYPTMPQITHQPHHQIPLFSLQDMRFFQHFLTQCCPNQPSKHDEIWTHEIPCIAYNHEFLMHAILGFAGSDLTRVDSSLMTAAMNHRIKAIRAIKKRLMEASRAETTSEEANAFVATYFALTLQSASLEDGLCEYMTFIRGIRAITDQMRKQGIKPLFKGLLDKNNELGTPIPYEIPLLQGGWAGAAVEAIANLRPLCADPVEAEYSEHLMRVAQKLYPNSLHACRVNSKEYIWWLTLPHASFQELTNLNRQTIVLLHTHWISLAQILAVISEREHGFRQKQSVTSDSCIDLGFVRWLRWLNARVDFEHMTYNQWPMWIDEQLDHDAAPCEAQGIGVARESLCVDERRGGRCFL